MISDAKKPSEIFHDNQIGITKALAIDLIPYITFLTNLPRLRDEESQFRSHSVGDNDVKKVILNMDEENMNLTDDVPAEILKTQRTNACSKSTIERLKKV